MVGEGGLGRVYRAVRISTGGPVAIKEVRDVSADSLAWRQARRELDAMLRVKGHAYVVSVEEILETERGPAIVMEYVSGGSMHDRYVAGPVEPGEFVLVGSQVSQALAAAHGVGVVHRDLKPQNLLVGQFGQVKVCDFGIAALNRDGHRTMVRAHTPGFASPEELAGADDIGPASDVYSLAATLAHLARGGRNGRYSMIDCGRELQEMSMRAPELASVIEVLQRGLRPHPEARPTMDELVDAFDDSFAALGRKRARAIRPMWLTPGRTEWGDEDVLATVVRGPSSSAQPANWYPDPSGRHEHRWWDGNRWSVHVSDGGVASEERPGPGRPAGWYPEESGPFDQRWFDGAMMTSQVMKHGAVGFEAAAGLPPALADWYPDPSTRFTHRYWNGSAWTARVATNGVELVDSGLDGVTPAGFYEDPMGRHERRYHDGVEWTCLVWIAGARFEEPSAAWYPDPTGRHELRWWNGLRWTSKVLDAGVAGQDAP